MKRAVVILGGGKGVRMGNDLPKQFIPLHGKPILMYTLEVFYCWDATARLILVLPEELQAYWAMLCRELNCTVPYHLATGGETRFHSVQKGLREVGDCELIGIHDGVRPMVSPQVIETCFRTAEDKGAVMAVVPSIDSLRMKIGNEPSRAVDRRNYYIVQTPQVFYRDWILEAYQQPYQPDFFDDATVVESSGKTIHLIEGNLENIKITTPMDLIVAEQLICNG